jgi:heat shock protein HtpX
MKKVSTVALMFLVALGVSVTLSAILELLGLVPFFEEPGINHFRLLVFCLVFGFLGSALLLLLSKTLAKRALRIEVLDPTRSDGEMRWLHETVRRLSDQAGLSKLPEVGIYSSPEANAFATGPTRDEALLALSTGLLSSMSRNEIEGVLAHEISHIENGDMLRMTLVQGVIDVLVGFAAGGVALLVSSLRSERERYRTRWIVIRAVETCFGFFGTLVVNASSRRREFGADRGGAALAGPLKMIAALEALRDRTTVPDRRDLRLATLKISSSPGGVDRLFMTHPPLQERIEALKQGL